jgi:hypothetical protein
VTERTIRFPAPAKPWGANDNWHWAKISPLKKAWKNAAAIYGRSSLVRPTEAIIPANVQVTIPFTSNRRRDPHNYTGTVVKAIIDGLVLAGYWPDDTEEYLTVLDPILTVGAEVIITISTRSDT